MTDPYKVLGVSPSDTDEHIKSVYRDLARKYHPDAYVNNPLADLAAEKMKEINSAYDQIVEMRKKGGGNSYAYGQSSGGYNYGQSSGGYGNYGQSSSGRTSQFADVRRLINQKRITDAEEILDGVPESSRDAEWYFLKGSIYYSRGWANEAFTYFKIAAQRDPSNAEYRTALSQLQWQRQQGYPGNSYSGGYNTTTSGCSGCDVCNGLICADCCCECMGGDLIRCC